MSGRLCSGHEVVAMSEEWLARMEQDQTLYQHGMVRLMPDGWLLPTVFTNIADKIYNFKLKSSDVVLMTMPKSGTTWMQEILWTMLHNPDQNHPQANMGILIRAPQIELDMFKDTKNTSMSLEHFKPAFKQMYPGGNHEDGFLQICERLPDRRLIKTHLPLSLMPPDLLDQAKVVYVARNPRDVSVSMCHHYRLLKLHNYKGSFEDFVKCFMKDDLLYSPYWPHVKMAWEKKDHPNMHFVFYEDMKADIMTELQKLNDFIGTNLTQKQLDNIAQYTSFAAMKGRENILEDVVDKDVEKNAGGFLRKGTTGDWKKHFSKELEQEMDQWIDSNATDIGIIFK